MRLGRSATPPHYLFSGAPLLRRGRSGDDHVVIGIDKIDGLSRVGQGKIYGCGAVVGVREFRGARTVRVHRVSAGESAALDEAVVAQRVRAGQVSVPVRREDAHVAVGEYITCGV